MSQDVFWSEFCGYKGARDLFWSARLSYNTSEPELTRCIQETLLVWVPCAWLWLGFAVQISFLLQKQNLNTFCGTSPLNKCKMVTCCLLFVVTSLNLWQHIHESRSGVLHPPVRFVSPPIVMATMVLAAFLTPYEYMKGVHSGSVLFVFWALLLVTGIVPFKSYVFLWQQRASGDGLVYRTAAFFVYYALVVVQFILHLFPDPSALGFKEKKTVSESIPLLQKKDKPLQSENINYEQNECPLAKASVLSRWFYLWVARLVIHGYRRKLSFKDLWDIRQEDSTHYMVEKFTEEWQRELEAYKPRQIYDNKGFEEIEMNGLHVPIPPGNAEDDPCNDIDKDAGPSLVKVIWRMFGPRYVLGGIYKFCYDIIGFINPQLLRLLIVYIGSRDLWDWHGYLLCLGLFLSAQVRALFGQAYTNVCFMTGMGIRTACLGAIHRKIIRINTESKSCPSAGQLLHMASKDVEMLQDASRFLHMLWSGPVVIVLSVYFLWRELGPSALAGVAAGLLLVPMNVGIMALIKKFQIRQTVVKDCRVNLLEELLNVIKVIKMYAWESAFFDKLLGIRDLELNMLKQGGYLMACSSVMWRMSPYLMSLVSFVVFITISPDESLNAERAFVSLALFYILAYPLTIFTSVITYCKQSRASTDRITSFLRKQEINQQAVQKPPMQREAVRIRQGTFSWSFPDPPVLSDINLRVPRGSYVAVVGEPGSGKTTLLYAIMGELEVLNGTTSVSGTIALVPQSPWIRDATIKENIMVDMSGQLKEGKYNDVIRTCDLLPDPEKRLGDDMMDNSFKAENATNDIRQRLGLARAMYRDPDIFVIDDISAGSECNSFIYDKIINGVLRKKTRIFVTSNKDHLPAADVVVVMRGGTIVETGGYNDLMRRGKELNQLLKREDSETRTNLEEDQLTTSAGVTRKLSLKLQELSHLPQSRGQKRKLKKGLENTRLMNRLKHEADSYNSQESELASKTVSTYIKAYGICQTVTTCLFFAVGTAARLGAYIWLSLWTDDPSQYGVSKSDKRDFLIGIYGALFVLQAFSVLVESIFISAGCAEAVSVLHSRLLGNILRAPVSHLKATPIPLVVKSFSRDMSLLDVNLPMVVRMWLGMVGGLLQTLVAISYATPVFLVVAAALTAGFVILTLVYLRFCQQVKRMELAKRARHGEYYGESVFGARTVREYGIKEQYLNTFSRLLDEDNMAYFSRVMGNRLTSILVETIGSFVLFFSAVLAVGYRTSISPSAAGLSVMYAMQCTGSLSLLTFMTKDMRHHFNAVCRIEGQIGCPEEEIEGSPVKKPFPSWPHKGEVRFHRVTAHYPGAQTPALKDLTCTVKPSEKIGVISRQPPSLSAVCDCLFRMVESMKGAVIIDGVALNQISLQALRERFTLITQDPLILTGTLRMNLDPYESHSDNELWTALERARLKEVVQKLPQKLESQCEEGHSRLSLGQQQLVCFARAFLRRSRILVLHDVTENVDAETKEIINELIQREFTGCTVLNASNNPKMISQCDRVMVLDEGYLAEFGTPTELRKNRGIYYSLLRERKS